MFIKNLTDITYIISIINRYIFNSNKLHWKIIKQIFRYFRHFLNFRFIFIDTFQLLKSYIDVDWIDNYNICCFISSYVFNLKNVVISWFSKRQFTITLSIYKIKYINQIQATKKVIWLSKLLEELHSNIINKVFAFDVFVYCLVVTIIYCNNQNAQTLIKNSISYVQSKYIDIQYYFVKNKIQNNTLKLCYIINNNQIINNLIKSLFKNKFLKFRRDIDLY